MAAVLSWELRSSPAEALTLVSDILLEPVWSLVASLVDGSGCTGPLLAAPSGGDSLCHSGKDSYTVLHTGV